MEIAELLRALPDQAPGIVGMLILAGGFLWMIHRQGNAMQALLATAKEERDQDRSERASDRKHRETMVRVCHEHHERWVQNVQPILEKTHGTMLEANGHMVACKRVAEDNMQAMRSFLDALARLTGGTK